jgi:hypothetical protein
MSGGREADVPECFGVELQVVETGGFSLLA